MHYFHNPNCTKSRQGLAYLTEKGYTPIVITYLETPPSPEVLQQLFSLTQDDPNSIIRQKEAKELGLKAQTDDEWIKAIQAHPIILERPILLTQNSAIIGRPHERLRTFVDQLST
jgi:arsenate reductase